MDLGVIPETSSNVDSAVRGGQKTVDPDPPDQSSRLARSPARP
jgi:hypothetical protein